MVLDRDQLDDAAGLVGTHSSRRTRRHHPAGKTDVVDLVQILGEQMLPQRDLLAAVTERERQVDLLTERQAVILGALRLLPRVEVVSYDPPVVTGPAALIASRWFET